MKKLCASVFIISLAFCICACGGETEKDESGEAMLEDSFALKEITQSYESMGLTVDEVTDSGITLDDYLTAKEESGGYYLIPLDSLLFDVVATGDLSEDELKELFQDEYEAPYGKPDKQRSEKPLGDRFFGPYYYGFGDDNFRIGVRKVTINGSTYTRQFDWFDTYDAYYYASCIKKDGEVFFKEEHYDEYAKMSSDYHEELEQKEKEEAEQAEADAKARENAASSSSDSAGPTHYAVCYYIISMYDYYEKNGGYDGDDYTDDAWRDAERRFDLSESEVEAAWTDYDANMKAMNDYNGTHN